jgi:hypothetical protein
VALALCVALCAGYCAWQAWRRGRAGGRGTDQQERETLALAGAQLGMVVAYCYACDRTELLYKDAKWYSFGMFAVGLAGVGASAVASVAKNKHSEQFLGRSQVHEIKGAALVCTGPRARPVLGCSLWAHPQALANRSLALCPSPGAWMARC